MKKNTSGSSSGSQPASPDEQGQLMTAGPVVSTAAAAAAAAATGTNVEASSSSEGIIMPTTPAAAAAAGAAAATTLSLHPIADATWEDRAVCYFFDQYTTFDCSSIGINHLGFLPSLYAKCQGQGDQADMSSACFRRAINATSLMALGNEAKVPKLIVQARSNYGQALRELRSALDTHSQAVKDETFATLAVLSMFEDIAGERKGLSSSHTVGFAMLMKLRGAGQLGHQQGRDLFNFAYTHTVSLFLCLGIFLILFANPMGIIARRAPFPARQTPFRYRLDRRPSRPYGPRPSTDHVRLQSQSSLCRSQFISILSGICNSQQTELLDRHGQTDRQRADGLVPIPSLRLAPANRSPTTHQRTTHHLPSPRALRRLELLSRRAHCPPKAHARVAPDPRVILRPCP